MARKGLSIFLVAVLLLSTGGLAISKHFCGDEAVSVAVNAKADPCCDDCDCCHDETSFVKLQEQFVSVEKLALNENFSPQSFLLPTFNVNLEQNSALPATTHVPSSPPGLYQHTVVLHQSFLL